MINTFKTVIGYLATLLNRIAPALFGGKTVEGIYNYLSYAAPAVTTSGQPNEEELILIADSGYSVVVNLAPHGVENALPDEQASVKRLGMKYHHIPVDFKRPSDDDFSAFSAAVEAYSNEKLWVHCAANMRVSAFVYRYRRTCLDHPAEEAEKELHSIWQPFGIWKEFVNS